MLIAGITYSQSADEVISKYFESIGGLDNWKNLKSLKLTGKVPTPQGEFSFALYKKAPDMMLTELDIQGKRLVPQAYDGEIAWTINPFMGSEDAQKLPEESTKELKNEAVFEDPFIDYAKKGHVVTLEGKENVDGTECYAVKLIKNKNNDKDEVTEIYYFDTEYYLPIKVKSYMLSGPTSGQEIETYMSNYEEIDGGLVMPFSLEVKMGGQTQNVITLEKIEVNPEINDDFFKFKEASEETGDED